jgi:hypothetical protein
MSDLKEALKKLDEKWKETDLLHSQVASKNEAIHKSEF